MKRLVLLSLLLLVTLSRADEAGTARFFDAIKGSPVELTAFLRAMPKGADLHNHLSGAIYGETWLDAAEEAGAFYDPETNALTMEENDRTVSIAEMKNKSEYYQNWLDKVSMRDWTPDRFNGHDHFFQTFEHFAAEGQEVSAASLLAKAIHRAEIQNIRYLELMTLPVGDAWPVMFANVPDTDDYEQLVAHVRSKADEFTKRAIAAMDRLGAEAQEKLGYAYPITDRRNPVYVRYIGAVNRNGSLKGMTVVLAAVCELMKKDPRVVGLQILAPEDYPTARKEFHKQMELFGRIYETYGHPNIALHAGELTLQIAPLEDMTCHIRDSIEVGKAKRVGHALSLAWEDDMWGLLEMMREKEILVEVCPTSNWSIAGLKEEDHPFRTYLKYGLPLSINTDDEGVSRSNLTQEFVRAVRWWDLDYPTLKRLVRNSVRYSFSEGKDEELERLQQAFERFEARWD
jgi:adenosine deaminase